VEKLTMTSLFISIFGPDGSGKSTQARILANYLMSRGFKVKIVWIKSYHTLSYILSEIVAKVFPNSVTLSPQGTIIRIDPVSNGLMNHLVWALIEFLSVLPLIIFHVYVPLIAGRIVIADRCIIDSVVSIAYTLNDSQFDSSLLAKAMLSLTPVKSVLIHLDSNFEEVRRRRGSLTDPEEFFNFQREMYNRLSKWLKAVRIDTAEQSVDETAIKIRSLVLQELKLD
jgi:thymidylate kinase